MGLGCRHIRRLREKVLVELSHKPERERERRREREYKGGKLGEMASRALVVSFSKTSRWSRDTFAYMAPRKRRTKALSSDTARFTRTSGVPRYPWLILDKSINSCPPPGGKHVRHKAPHPPSPSILYNHQQRANCSGGRANMRTSDKQSEKEDQKIPPRPCSHLISSGEN